MPESSSTMKIDAREILERLGAKNDRIRRSIFVSESIYSEFQKACGNVAVSTVLEDLMKQFTDSAKGKKKSD